ncbi:MAG: glycosyltransferase, partial [Candidatus Binatia bacterium]
QTDVVDQYKDAYKRMFSYASAIVAVSKHMIEQLIRLGAPTEKIAYIPYGVDIGKFAQASVLTSPLRVLSVGRFVEKKAPYLTILAFNKVLSRLPEARLVMVGAGPLHDVCCKLIKALRIEHAVELGGIANHDTVAALMQGARVFVQHSLVPLSGDTEGTPVAILEAGAAGLPVVSTHHAGISDVVIHGKTGFLVDEGDIQAMADYIYQLLTDPDLASIMGHNAREHVRANFTMQRSIGQLRNILEHCTTRDSTAIPELLSSPAASISSEEESASY